MTEKQTEGTTENAQTETSKANASDVSQLPEWAQSELSRARNDAANYRTRLREAEAARDSLQTSLDAEATKVKNLEATHEDTKLAGLKFEAALDALGIDASPANALADRLRGNTIDELKTDAKSVTDAFGGIGDTKRRATDRSAGRGNETDKASTPEETFGDFLSGKLGWGQ